MKKLLKTLRKLSLFLKQYVLNYFKYNIFYNKMFIKFGKGEAKVAEAYTDLGDCYEQLKKEDEALYYYEKSLEIN